MLYINLGPVSVFILNSVFQSNRGLEKWLEWYGYPTQVLRRSVISRLSKPSNLYNSRVRKFRPEKFIPARV